jgi:hypothetical protein
MAVLPRITVLLIAAWSVPLWLGAAAAGGQRTDAFVESRDHPAIAYSTAPAHDAVAALKASIESGASGLRFDPGTGYLRATLEALRVPVESQVLVFSQTSRQADRINLHNPRALYFNDTVAVGWVRGGDVLELAAHDARQGVSFYTIEQTSAEKPRISRENSCLACHLSWETLGVPGPVLLSTFQMSDDPRAYASGVTPDHRTPLALRWGGWYVTGDAGGALHLGNVPVVVKAAELGRPAAPPPQLSTVAGRFDTRDYPTLHSDIVALMVLDHQVHMTNLLTRLGWEARIDASMARRAQMPSPSIDVDTVSPRVAQAADDLVDYLLFVEEEPLAGPIAGSSGFARQFSARGPVDAQGRSLRQFDLVTRLMRYRCSYMLYSPAFDALPPGAKRAVYGRMWRILSGAAGERYSQLSRSERVAIVEILRATKNDLPPVFRGTVR